MRALWGGPSQRFRHVLRGRDGLVHVVLNSVPFVTKIDAKGVVVAEIDASLVITTCNLRVKMNSGGRNRYTEQIVTCLVCVVGGHR